MNKFLISTPACKTKDIYLIPVATEQIIVMGRTHLIHAELIGVAGNLNLFWLAPKTANKLKQYRPLVAMSSIS